MQESPSAQSYEIRKFIGIIIPIFILGCIAIATPFAVLNNNEPPPYNPPPPGWESSVSIYLWAAWFGSAFIQVEYSFGGVTNFHTIPFLIMAVLYFIIHIGVGLRKIPAKSGAGFDVMVLVIWITLCYLIYGTLRDWSLIQVPFIPIVGVILLLVVYGNQVFQLSPTTPASSSYLSS